MYRQNKRVSVLVLASLMLVLLLAACVASPAAAPAAAPAEPAAAPAAAAASGDMVEASKGETEGLLIYSIMSE